MEPDKARAAGDEVYRRLQLSLLLRAILVTFLLGATVFISFSRTASFLNRTLIALYILSGTTFFVTLVSAILIRVLKRLTLFSYFQALYEVLFVTALIWITTTDSFESIFTFLYPLTIIMAGILMYRRGAFLAAVSGSVCYGLLLAAMKWGYLPALLTTGGFRPEDVKLNELIYNFFVNMAAMFGTAVLASYLTEKLRATGDELQETMRDRDALEALNDNIVRSLASGVLTLNREGRITSINEAAASFAGVPGVQALGKGFITLFPEAAAALVVAGEGSRPRFEAVWRNALGEPRYYEFRVSPLLGSGDGVLGSLLIFDDVTDLRGMEQRLRQTDRLAAVGRLAAGIAHEIRNPLASISGSIQMLDQELALDAVNRRLMKIVIRETDRLNGLITDFLLYARPGPRAFEEVFLDRLIAELVQVGRNRPGMPANLAWELELQPNLAVRTDPRLFEQVLWNLVNNAVQAQPGGGRVCIRARRLAPEGGPGRVRLEVEDGGPGIPPDLLEKIFDPFFTTREGGTGLGLSIVYRIAEGMDGTVRAENVSGGGARFIMEIPERAAAQPETGGKGNGSG